MLGDEGARPKDFRCEVLLCIESGEAANSRWQSFTLLVYLTGSSTLTFSKKDFQKVFKEVVTELGSCKYDKWSFITARHKKLGVILGDYFLHNDLKKIIGRNPSFLRHIKFDVFGKPVSLKPMDTKSSIPKELLQIESSVLNGVRKVKLRLPYWILFRNLHKIHMNKKGLSPQGQMKNINEVYERYCSEDKTTP